MTSEQRDELRAMYEAASGGEWGVASYDPPQVIVNHPSGMVCNTLHGDDEANATFIAVNHNALPSLLADSERAEALEGALRELVEFIVEKNVSDKVYYDPDSSMTYNMPSDAFIALMGETAELLGDGDTAPISSERAAQDDVPLEPDGGNLYRPHPFMVNSGRFWRCAHGTTGYASGMKWAGCGECAEADPEAFARFSPS